MLNYNLKQITLKGGAKVYVPILEPVTPVDFRGLAEAIQAETTLTTTDVRIILSALEEHLIRALLAGQKVRFGDLGTFGVELHNGATVTEKKKFKINDKTRVRVRFRPSPWLKNETRVGAGNQRLKMVRRAVYKKDLNNKWVIDASLS
ncbi:MAG: HU family DNA-binding protein [Bacteroidales bacterium]|nr:HU family DNA-binding protein [Bacteroidales bacterium]